MGGITRRFLDWNRPLLACAVELLSEGWTEGPLDLSHLLVIVPTRNAGRRLREALAAHAASRDTGVIPPAIAPPEVLVAPLAGARVAGQTASLMAWIDTLRALDPADFRGLFPVDPVERNFSWALRIAADLAQLRGTLGENGLTLASVHASGLLATERERWRDLAELERRTLHRLDAAGLEDLQLARLRAVDAPVFPEGVRKIVVIAVPDPIGLATRALAAAARALPVEIVLHAPAARHAGFDAFGRPLPLPWTTCMIDIPEAKSRIHLRANPAAQAGEVARILAGSGAPPGSTTIGVPDEEIIPYLDRELAALGLASFDPSGQLLRRHGSHFLLETLSSLLRGRPFSAFAEILRCPDFLTALARSYSGGNFSRSALLKQIDTLRSENLPDSLDDAARTLSRKDGDHAPAEALHALRVVTAWLDRLEDEPFASVLPAFLTSVHAHREFHPDDPNDAAFLALAETVNRFLSELEGPVFRDVARPLGADECMELLLHELRSVRVPHEREPEAIDLHGWLELPWEDAPHLLLTGFNDGLVPDTLVGDPYLPDSARNLLGLRGNATRLARDSYLLTALIESRRAHGQVDIFVAKESNAGDPRRPSRLLFRCDDTSLAPRALQLFEAPPAPVAPPAAAWSRAWKLVPESLPEATKLNQSIRVTAFRDYLSCPFRFYLKQGLRMESVDPAKIEMDARDFGNLIHHVMECFGNDHAIRDSRNPAEIREFFHRIADSYATGRFGSPLTVPLMIQLESAKQRLSRAAAIQAAERADGWIFHADPEWAIHEHLDWKFQGLDLHGTIDRIERNEKTGDLRVIDYKTSNKPSKPEEAHLAKSGRHFDPGAYPDWQITEGPDGKPRRWSNLQLPLYVAALRRLHGEDTRVSCGYFNLPRAVSETRIEVWESLTERQFASALRCADGIAARIRDRIFWPPSEKPEFDDFKDIFFGNATDAIDEEAFAEALCKPDIHDH